MHQFSSLLTSAEQPANGGGGRSPDRHHAIEQPPSGAQPGGVAAPTASGRDVSPESCESGERSRPAQGAGHAVLWLRQLLGRAVLGPERQHLGHLRDVVVRCTRDGGGALVSGVIVDAGGEHFGVPAEAVRAWRDSSVVLSALVLRAQRRRQDEVFLAADLLGQPVVGSAEDGLPRISDVALRRTPAGWVVGAVDTRGPVRRLLGSPRRVIDWEALVARWVLPQPPLTP